MKEDAAIPALPSILTRKNPTDEQLAHILEIVPSVEPEKKDTPNFTL
jgi:hypothetical protein